MKYVEYIYLLSQYLSNSYSAPDLINEYSITHNIDEGFNSQLDCPYPLRTQPSHTFDALVKLFDLDRMSQEYKILEITTLSTITISTSPLTCQDLVLSTVKWNECYEDWSSTTSMLSHDGLLNHLGSASSTLGKASQLAQNVDIMGHALSLSICRSLRFIYQFRMVFGRDLFTVIVQDYCQTGKTAVDLKWPMVAELVDTVIVWAQKSQIAAKAAKRKRDGLPKSFELSLAPEIFASLNVVPSTAVELKVQASVLVGLGTEAQFIEFVQEKLVDILVQTIILPNLTFSDRYINQHRSNQAADTSEAVLHRSIIRGAMLDMFVDWLDDDGIFASSLMLKVIASPGLILGDGKDNDKVLAKKILRGYRVFASLENWLSEEYEVGDVQEVAATLAKTVQESLSRMAKPMHVNRSSGRMRNRRGISLAALFANIPPAPVNSLLLHLLPFSDGFRIDMLAFIIREALNKRLGRGTGDSSLSRLICGEDPLTNSKSSIRDPDHYEPIRAYNNFQRAIESSFGNRNMLSDDYTLSNILVWLGTGQGTMTKQFVSHYLHGRWFTSADACVKTFEEAYMTNPRMALDNMKCWGTPCSWLSFERDDSSTPLFHKRLDPMFSLDVIEKWCLFRNNTHRTYIDGLQLSKAIDVAGFGSGITQMQFANTLALLGLCNLPSCDEMAKVVRANKRMGAFEGLQRLGLNVNAGSSEVDVRDAFRCVYDTLDHLLASADKVSLRFNAIFVEHLLCKVSRWEKMFPKKAVKTLRRMAEVERNRGIFETEGNGPTIFPFALQVERQNIYNWITQDYVRIGQ